MAAGTPTEAAVRLQQRNRLAALRAHLAEAEQQASQKLLEAARTLAEQPEAMQLRYLQTLTVIAGDKSNTIVFPVDMLAAFSQALGRGKGV